MTKIPEPVRRFVIRRAGNCCEYCLVSQEDSSFPHEVDHAIAQKHRGQTIEANLCYSCMVCNRHKGSDIASIDEESGHIVALFNPRLDRWADHFRLEGAKIVPLTPVGRVTEFLLQFNVSERLMGRAILHQVGRYPCK